MPAIQRVLDIHACGSMNVGGAATVYAEGRRVHRMGDIDVHSGRISVTISCSSTVFIGGYGVSKVGNIHGGHPGHRTSPHITGCSSVFVDDKSS